MLTSALFRRLLFSLLLAVRLAAAEPVLDTVAKVRALTPEVAARALPVSLDATVIYFDPNNTPCLFIQDQTACTWVVYHRFVQAQKAPVEWYSMNLKPGERIHIEGTTYNGDFFPVIQDQQIDLLGKGLLPEPRPIGEDELMSPALDSQWVEVPAVVTGLEKGDKAFTISIEVHGWKLKAVLPQDAHSAERAAALMQRPVRLQGVAGTIFNDDRQMTGRYFFVPSFDQIIPTDKQASAANPPLRAVSELLRNDDTANTLVRIEGVVTQADENDLYLRDASGSVQVHTAKKISFVPGDRIEAEGFAAIAPYRPIFRARKIAVTGRTELPKPMTLDFSEKKLPHFQDELVAFDAGFLARNGGDTGIVLHCRMGDRFLDAVLPRGGTLPNDLAPGDRVRLTGICELTTTRPLEHFWNVDGFRLHLPKTGGMVILSHAPWWTLKHLLIVIGIISTVAILAVCWVLLLHSRVMAQTKIIGNQIQREAVHEERQRIARELHDSIEQELASLSLQLGNISVDIRQMPDGVSAPVRDSIQVAQKMLHHCRSEARTSIRDLRSIELEQRGLPGALQQLLPGVAAGCGADFQMHISGIPRPLDGIAETHLLRIAQEGVANAAHHADARTITVDLDYSPEAVALVIRDDGCGMDPTAPVPDGHFGLRGIRERANKIQAVLDIQSAPGKGTTIRIVVPVNNQKD
jgi:signal transduction histidine kinase